MYFINTQHDHINTARSYNMITIRYYVSFGDRASVVRGNHIHWNVTQICAESYIKLSVFISLPEDSHQPCLACAYNPDSYWIILLLLLLWFCQN